MSDHRLRVNDDTSEVRDIEAFVDLRLIRDLEVVFSGLPVEGMTTEPQAELVEIVLEITDLRLRLEIVVIAMTEITDEVELRARHHLFDISKKDVLVAPGIARIPEQIAINNVF